MPHMIVVHFNTHIFTDTNCNGMSLCQPGAITNRPSSNIQHWQNVDTETERTLSTETGTEAISSTVLYQQQQLH